MQTFGPKVISWIETNCVLPKGDNYGGEVILADFQCDIINRMFEYIDTDIGPRLVYQEILIGLPKGSGKTPLAAMIGLFLLCSGFYKDPKIAVGAASFEQADLVFGDMKTIAELSPRIAQSVDVFDTKIVLKHFPGRALRVAAARGSNDGKDLCVFLSDETHEWNTPASEGQHLVLTNGLQKRSNSLGINITTAGVDYDSLLGKMYLRGKRIQAGEEPHHGFLFIWHEGPEQFDFSDDSQLRAALRTAYKAPWVDIDRVFRRCRQIPEFEARRYYLNQWTRSDESWLPPGAWEACKDISSFEIDPDLPSFVGIDMALKHDTIGVVIAQVRPDGRTAVLSKTWAPDNQVVDIQAIEKYLRELHRNYNVVEFGYDPAYFERSAQVLEDEGLCMLEFSQSRSRMVPACGNAYEMIVSGTVIHNGDPTLTDHVLSAAQRQADNGWTLSKGRSKRKIDACIAMVMALWLATGRATDEVPKIFIF